ncbi:helix-turn-helix domain-containing protein [Vibrio diabolicus]|uniref:helix-turn-helix domain-containing protein n=1 Tax=Vibrio diabolicus TaxID=50719 RepID=UPI0015F45F02|nr:AraC family transcriptional regulator [Vibrio diabolicus]
MRRLHDNLILTSSESLLYYIPYFESNGIRWQEVADEFDLPYENPRAEAWIPMRSFSLFLNKMAKLCKDDMPLLVGKNTALSIIEGRWGLVEKEASFKHVLQSLMTNEHRFSRQNVYWLEQISGTWCLCNRSTLKPSFPGSDVNEWFRVSLLLNICRHWLGDDWLPKSLNVMTDETQGSRYHNLLFPNVNIRFGQPFMSIELTGVDALEAMTNRSLKSRDIGEVRLLAESYCHLPHFTLDWLAALFGVTSKTLYRYFKDHGTSFKEIKKRAVLERSEQLLRDTDEPVSNIAYQMGYEDVSNFNRAIKAMRGSTPAQLRLGFKESGKG